MDIRWMDMFRVCKDADLCKWVYCGIDWRSIGCIL